MIHDETSAGEHRSNSVENDQISKKLDPQGVGSLLRILMSNFALYVNKKDAQDQSLMECSTGPVRTWMMDMQISWHNGEKTRYLVPINILWSNLETKLYRDRSTSWCPNHLSSWQTWNWNSNPFHMWIQYQWFDGHIPRLSYETKIQNILTSAKTARLA